ncbi:hypothetical protein NP233_g3584 [Leucocoprinus birnbaumii]|uniref:Uncharacterized protein n=1 Tax=Leucocoprinus birnbaumii TaxID=56174 RepID=A0AAD5W2U3_9AGAR|nr:hypothetical protein NP233_g3584 [Leucocoprinus birnbaumii]
MKLDTLRHMSRSTVQAHHQSAGMTVGVSQWSKADPLCQDQPFSIQSKYAATFSGDTVLVKVQRIRSRQTMGALRRFWDRLFAEECGAAAAIPSSNLLTLAKKLHGYVALSEGQVAALDETMVQKCKSFSLTPETRGLRRQFDRLVRSTMIRVPSSVRVAHDQEIRA